MDSEQKNSGQRSTGHKSGQKSAIKSKRNFSSIFTEITEDDKQSISAHKAVLSVYSGSKISLDNSFKK